MHKGRRTRNRILFYAALAAMMLQTAPAPVPARNSLPSPERAPAAPQARVSLPAVPALAPAPAPDPGFGRVAAPAGTMSVSGSPVHAELDIDHWLRPGEYAWNDENAPAGPTIVVANLRARVLSVYRAGYEIGRTNIIYGADHKATPVGLFPILEKDAVHFSSIYDGAPMPFMLRLTMDGVSLHGSKTADNLVTHGCIGMPVEFARLLFSAVRVGDKVLIRQS